MNRPTKKPKPTPDPTPTPLPPGIEATPATLRSLLVAGAVPPGSVVWLTNGVYEGLFESRVVGTSTGRITFRQAPGHTAVIHGNLQVWGAYTDWWGFKATNLDGATSFPGDGVEIFA